MCAMDYKQYNYNATYCGGSFASQACGPCSVADIVEISPLTVAQWMTNNGYATTDGHGTYWGGINAALTAFGAGGKMLNGSSLLGTTSHSVFDTWKKEIQSGKMGVLLTGYGVNNYWTNSGHYIAVVGYKDGKYLIYDPASTVRTGYHSFSDLAGNIKICYTSEKRWTSASTPNSTYSFKVTQIKSGDTGKMVLFLQKLLRSRGLYSGKLDSSFGTQTDKAVRNYQKWINNHGGKLAVDGICGPATWTSILGIEGDPKVVQQVKEGDKNVSVYLAQEILWSDNYYTGSLDMSFGPATRAAVIAFQKKKKIAQDGVCGPTTFKLLINL